MSDEVPKVDVEPREDAGALLSLDPETMDPSLQYRFVRNDPLRISRVRMKGYRPVEKESGVRVLAEADASSDNADGLIRVGDTILYACPKDRYVKRKGGERDLANSRIHMARQVVEKKVKDSAAPVRTFTNRATNEPGA